MYIKLNRNFEINLNYKPHTRTDTTLHQTVENCQDEVNLQFSSPANNSFTLHLQSIFSSFSPSLVNIIQKEPLHVKCNGTAVKYPNLNPWHIVTLIMSCKLLIELKSSFCWLKQIRICQIQQINGASQDTKRLEELLSERKLFVILLMT